MGFTNRDRLRRKMKAIPVEVRKAVRGQLKANALELRETIKGFVPVDTGDLKDSIRARDVSDSTRMRWSVTAGNVRAPYYAMWVEFGTKASAAQASRPNLRFKSIVVMTRDLKAHHATEAKPFFWPAYRLKKRRFKLRISRAVKKAIQGVAS